MVQDPSDMSKVAYPALCVPLCLRILRTCVRIVRILHFVYHGTGSFGHVQGCLSCTLCTIVSQDPSDMCKDSPDPALCVPWYRILRTNRTCVGNPGQVCISEVARVVLGVGKGVLFREVSSVQECPQREKFLCYSQIIIHVNYVYQGVCVCVCNH